MGLTPKKTTTEVFEQPTQRLKSWTCYSQIEPKKLEWETNRKGIQRISGSTKHI